MFEVVVTRAIFTIYLSLMFYLVSYWNNDVQVHVTVTSIKSSGIVNWGWQYGGASRTTDGRQKSRTETFHYVPLDQFCLGIYYSYVKFTYITYSQPSIYKRLYNCCLRCKANALFCKLNLSTVLTESTSLCLHESSLFSHPR